jgi:hypothetical protein
MNADGLKETLDKIAYISLIGDIMVLSTSWAYQFLHNRAILGFNIDFLEINFICVDILGVIVIISMAMMTVLAYHRFIEKRAIW